MSTMNTTPSTTPRAGLASLTLLTALTVLYAPSLTHAQAPLSKNEAEQLVPPRGSAVDVPVHAGSACVLSFPEKISPHAISSSTDFEIQPWRQDGIAIRAVNNKAAPSTLALATGSARHHRARDRHDSTRSRRPAPPAGAGDRHGEWSQHGAHRSRLELR